MQPNQTPPQPTPPSQTPPPPPPPTPEQLAAPPQQSPGGLAISSLVLGIVGIFSSWVMIGLPFAIGGLVLGIISLAKKMPGRGLAIAGTVISSLAVLSAILMFLLSLIFINAASESLNKRSTTSANRSTARMVIIKAEAYNTIVGDAEQSSYPDYQTLISQTEVAESVLDDATAEALSDGSVHSASIDHPVTYRGCTDGAIVGYWDEYSNHIQTIDAGQPSLCDFARRT